MALKWFKKKKHAKEEKTPSDRNIDDTSDGLKIENSADTPASDIHKSPEHPESKNETPQPPQADGPEADGATVKKPSGFFKRLKSGLSKTRQILTL